MDRKMFYLQMKNIKRLLKLFCKRKGNLEQVKNYVI